ncbi:class I SAM-dependent methyltransferase [Dehalococcoidia bacterium]|nr:class I SAM-dependent methyltransferase [Dehalococcoidia bacterium]
MVVDITMLRQALREADVYICSSVNTERFQTVENNWGILYLQYPEVYDRFCTTGRDGAEERLIKAILQQYNHPIFLDVACGTGRSLLPYLDIMKEAYGVDISKEMLRVARDNLSAAGYKDVELALGDACKLPYPMEKFDVVNSSFAAVWDADPEIRLQKQEQSILEALRVLKTGAIYLGSVESSENRRNMHLSWSDPWMVWWQSGPGDLGQGPFRVSGSGRTGIRSTLHQTRF